ncbi:hypothetical protein QWM81_01550 [Streptomyces ficellus]|uniref:DUF4280 domain-containing protein n=1 Tax=Streptomyces ficellus TaxID=1977088 RepID=A0ABT7YZU8_9ACTN|nr:hypothetical protein [Streptomyces ficellus]MDN3292747.1 hypothetical protein [Streptomyces ficellus]
MSGNVIHAGTLIGCPHGGRAGAAPAPSHSVLLDSLPAATGALVHTVTGCRHTVDGVPVPCTSVRWTPAADSVLVDGAPVLLESTPGLCFTAGLVPQGPPVITTAADRGVACG